MPGPEEFSLPGSRLNRDSAGFKGSALAFGFSSLFTILFVFPMHSWAVDSEALIRDGLMQKARQTTGQGEYEGASAIYKQLIQNNPKDIEAQIGRAHV